MMRCTVWGAGSFGTALAVRLAAKGHDVRMWDRSPERAAHINATHRNPQHLSDLTLPDGLVATSDLQEATAHAELLVPCVPSHALRQVASQAAEALSPDALVCCATKGIEEGTLDLMPGVLADELGGDERITLLSGPSFAGELARGLPTTVVVAGLAMASEAVVDAFHGGGLRVYQSDDLTGVAIGGSFKNIIAVACGISDGLGLGSNTRAALITRGLAEMSRVADALGGRPETLAGLAGLGDLVLTCTGDASRNRRVGLALGRGLALDAVLAELGEVAEGVTTAKSGWYLGEKLGVPLPITEQVYEVLHRGRSAADGMRLLMTRERRPERD